MFNTIVSPETAEVIATCFGFALFLFVACAAATGLVFVFCPKYRRAIIEDLKG